MPNDSAKVRCEAACDRLDAWGYSASTVLVGYRHTLHYAIASRSARQRDVELALGTRVAARVRFGLSHAFIPAGVAQ